MEQNNSEDDVNKGSYKYDGDSYDICDRWIRSNCMNTKTMMEVRWAIYFHIVKLAEKLTIKLLPNAKSNIERARHELAMERQMADGLILKQADIVGMTTTGASKYHDLLEIAKPEIVIIEEAAEILEAHMVTSLTSHCKHLILIGDHLQLRPSTNVYHLARKFHLDLSFFERMINNDVNLWSLKTQHRMRPEISDLIIGPIYEELHNHKTVFHYPDVRGVGKNVFLISHTELEETDNQILSKSNAHEADFLTTFCYYLIKQGYDSDKITILTTYTGQMFLLKKKLREDCGRVRITCVDNYQGEENDIILLSLVRSNAENKIGFVGIENRICVALSRAKHGLFIIGNVKSLTARSETWTQICKKLDVKGNCGEGLPLKCQRHQTLTYVKRAKDFSPLIKLGGCKLNCDFKLKCGHICVLKCHGLDQKHQQYRCKEKCEKLCRKELHPCTAKCFRDCPKCTAEVINELKCGHQKEMYCFEDPTMTVCQVIVARILPKCGHEEPLPCHMEYRSYSCRKRVKKVLKCDHIKEMECHMDEKLVICKELVEKELPCGHSQFVHCFVKPDDARCLTEVLFVFPHCNHEQKLPCWRTKTAKCVAQCCVPLKCEHKSRRHTCHVTDDPNHEKYICKELVEKQLPCGHEESLECHMESRSYCCRKRVKKALKCDHIKEMECHMDEKLVSCNELVEKQLPCGHNQFVHCFVKPDDARCLTEVLFGFPHCNHQQKLPCWKTKTAKCVAQCCVPLKCEHKCRLTCHVTDDPNHEKYICKKKCKRDCGFPEYHPCQTNHRCSETCPPCYVSVTKTLPCDPEHTAELACHDDGQTYKCQREINKQLTCGHEARKKCGDVIDGSDCHVLKLMTCAKCHHERYVLCCFTKMLGCVNQECREKYTTVSEIE